MKNITLTLLGMVLLLSFCSASIFYSGENYSIDLSNDFNSLNNYSIDGNLSNLDGFNLELNGTKVFIWTELGYFPDSFNLTIYGDGKSAEITEEVITKHSGGGGSCSSTKWNCGNWSKCLDNSQIRKCKSNCQSLKNESQVCGILPINETSSDNINETLIPDESKEIKPFYKTFYFWFSFFLVIIFTFIVYLNKRKKDGIPLQKP